MPKATLPSLFLPPHASHHPAARPRAGPDAAKSGWAQESLLPALRHEAGMSRRQVAEAVLKFPGGWGRAGPQFSRHCWLAGWLAGSWLAAGTSAILSPNNTATNAGRMALPVHA